MGTNAEHEGKVFLKLFTRMGLRISSEPRTLDVGWGPGRVREVFITELGCLWR